MRSKSLLCVSVSVFLFILYLLSLSLSPAPPDINLGELKNSWPPTACLRNSSWSCPQTVVSLPGPFFYPAQNIDIKLQISEENLPPLCGPLTPLFIVFASKFCMLEQALLSYIAEGWPPSHIIVVDNTGTASPEPNHHAYLNYSRLTEEYGTSIYRLPTRQSFSQVQNYIRELAMTQSWSDFYISHQDVVVRSQREMKPYTSFYNRVLIENCETHQRYLNAEWALTFFAYDWLSHVGIPASRDIGPWDVLIPWYPSDCDYYSRARLKGKVIYDFKAGKVYDVADCLLDARRRLFLPASDPEAAEVDRELLSMATQKRTGSAGRNTWQGGGLLGGEDDFGDRYAALVKAGRKNFRWKWGTDECDVTHGPSLIDRLWWKVQDYLEGRSSQM